MTDSLLALFVDFDWSQFALRTTIGAAFVVLGLMCVVATVLGLPGLWGLLLIAGGIELSDLALREDGTHTFSPWTLAIAAGPQS